MGLASRQYKGFGQPHAVRRHGTKQKRKVIVAGNSHPFKITQRRNPTKFFHSAQRWALTGLVLCVPMLLALLALEFVANPNPVPAVITIAGLVLLCFFFAYVFVTPDDFSLSATDRTLGIASKIFVHTRHGLTPEAALGASKIILPETLASAICITDGHAVVASWGMGSEHCPVGQPVVLETTLRVIGSKQTSVFSRDVTTGDGHRFFPRLKAGIVAPLVVRNRCMGTLELYYPRYSDIDARQTALATGFADLISTQLASFELERQEDVSARMELRALQSQVDPHFLFNTIGTIVSLVRTEPEKARSLLIDFSNYYRQTLSNSDALTSLENELGQGMRYINLMQARYGEDRLRLEAHLDPATLDCAVPPFILQPLLENCIKHAMREVEPLSIRLSSRETDDGVEIVVEDDGIGMSPKTVEHLFDTKRTCGCEACNQGSACAADGAGTQVGTAGAPGAPGTPGERMEPATADGSFKRGSGLALSNVLQRIHFFFGEESGIRVASKEGVGTRVAVELIGEPHEPENALL